MPIQPGERALSSPSTRCERAKPAATATLRSPRLRLGWSAKSTQGSRRWTARWRSSIGPASSGRDGENRCRLGGGFRRGHCRHSRGRRPRIARCADVDRRWQRAGSGRGCRRQCCARSGVLAHVGGRRGRSDAPLGIGDNVDRWALGWQLRCHGRAPYAVATITSTKIAA